MSIKGKLSLTSMFALSPHISSHFRYSAEVERMYHQLKGEATAGQQAKGARHGGSTHEEKPWHPAKSGNKG